MLAYVGSAMLKLTTGLLQRKRLPKGAAGMFAEGSHKVTPDCCCAESESSVAP